MPSDKCSQENTDKQFRSKVDFLLPSVLESHKYELPKKYEIYSLIFQDIEEIVKVNYNTKNRVTFKEICESKNAKKRNINETHLAKIIGLYPKAYKIHWEMKTSIKKTPNSIPHYDLVIMPNLNNDEDISPFWIMNDKKIKDEPPSSPLMSPVKLISPTKGARMERDIILRSPTKTPQPIVKLSSLEGRKKMEGWRATCRKLIFKYLLVTKIREHLSIPEGEHWDPKLTKSLPDLEPAEHKYFPQRPNKTPMTPKSTDIRQFLQSVTPERSRSTTPLGRCSAQRSTTPTSRSPDIRQFMSSKRRLFAEQGTTSPLLERLRAKEMTIKVEDSDKQPLLTRRSQLNLIQRELLDVLKSFMNVNCKSSIDIKDEKFNQAIRSSCDREVLRQLKELMDELCSIVSSHCSMVLCGSIVCFKITNGRNDNDGNNWYVHAKKVIAEELKYVEGELDKITSPIAPQIDFSKDQE